MSHPATQTGRAFHQIVNAENNAQGNPIFVGWAVPGTANSDPNWLIAQITYDGTGNFFESLRYANGKIDYNVAWDDRALPPYS